MLHRFQTPSLSLAKTPDTLPIRHSTSSEVCNGIAGSGGSQVDTGRHNFKRSAIKSDHWCVIAKTQHLGFRLADFLSELRGCSGYVVEECLTSFDFCARGHQRGVPPLKSGNFTAIGSCSVKTIADRWYMTLIVTSTGRGLLRFINIDDLE